MHTIYRTELKRAFWNPRFILVFLLAGISFAYGYSQISPMQSHSPLGAFTAWQEILNAGYYGFFAATLAVLPFADSLSRDKNEGRLEPILLRTSYTQFKRAKALAVALSGAAAVMLPAVCMLAYCYLVYPAGPVHIPGINLNFGELFNRTVVEPGIVFNPSITKYAIASILQLGIFGMAYALLGMSISFLTRNAMIVLGFPFICYSFGTYVIRTSRHLYWMMSTEALMTLEGNLLSSTIQITLIILFFILSSIHLGRKERQVLQ
jgi:hypothetical protein